MLTSIYLHCQAPPSTFCRGRYRNFVDWKSSYLTLNIIVTLKCGLQIT